MADGGQAQTPAPILTWVRLVEASERVASSHLPVAGRCPICEVPLCDPFVLAIATLMTAFGKVPL